MANRYWVGGTGNWDTSTTTNWSATSGGAGGASVPTSIDDVFFDANSNGGSAFTATINDSVSCNNLDFTGFTRTLGATFGGNKRIFCYGSVVFVNTMTITATANYGNNITFESTTTGKTITSNGKTVPMSFYFNGVGGGWSLADNLNINQGGIMLTNGTLNFNNNNVSCGYIDSDNSNARTLTLGSGTILLIGLSNIQDIWNFTTTTNLTFNANASTIKIDRTYLPSQNLTNFIGGSKTFNNLWITGTKVGNFKLSGSNTFADFKDDQNIEHSLIFTDGTTQTITSLTVNGSAGKLITLTGTSSGGWTISDTTGGTNTVTYCNISYSAAMEATWEAFLDTNINGGNNSGWYFYAPFIDPANIYSSNNAYTTLPATSGILTVEVSKDAGVNWLVAKTVTFTGSDTLQTVGNSNTELWGSSFTRADTIDTLLRVRLSQGGYGQVYKTFGFSTGTDILTGIEVAIEGNYASSTLSLDLLEIKIYYGTSVLPIQAGSQVYVSDGRKAGEGAGAGTGVLVYYDGTNWIASDTGATVDD